jgi:hypothetical protein
VVENGRLTGIDEEDLKRAARVAAARILGAG